MESTNPDLEGHIAQLTQLDTIPQQLRDMFINTYVASAHFKTRILQSTLQELAVITLGIIWIWEQPYHLLRENYIYRGNLNNEQKIKLLGAVNSARGNIMRYIQEREVCWGIHIEDYFRCDFETTYPHPSLWDKSQEIQYTPINELARHGLTETPEFQHI